MSENGRIAELERELARLRSELFELRMGQVSSEDAMVNQVLRDRSVLENLPDIVTVLDRRHRLVYLNRTLPGLDVRDLIGTSALDAILPEDRERYCSVFDQVWATGLPASFEIRTLSHYWWESRFVPVHVDGQIAFILATSVEVTQRKRAEQALRESETRLRLALDATGMGTWSWTSATDELVLDALSCRIFGVEPERAPRGYTEYLQLVHPDDRPRVRAALVRCRQNGTYDDLEHRLVRPGGELRHVLSKGTVIRDEAGNWNGVRGGLFDTTDRKRLEQQLSQGQKMEAIGELTAGIAHNFNNLLSVILPNVALAQSAQGPELAACLDDIAHAAHRAADMIAQLMLFARRGTSVRPESVDLAATLRRTLQICRNTFDRGIEIELIEGDALPTVAANAGQLEQVLLNICINARDAIEQAQPTQPRIQVRTSRASDGWAQIRIVDNGIGMDEETRQRVFEPFFTTKEVGRGTGLGLASAYAIVMEHGGRISCESEVGLGSGFEIELPPALEPVSHAPVEIAPTPFERGRGELVLLVDDEPLVRRAAAATLVWGGYRVLEAAGGHEAIAHIERASDVGLVLLDRSMPGMSGEQVAQRIKAIDATIPIVLLSGQASSTPSPPEATAALSKPVDADTLLRTIRYAIDARLRS